MQRREFLAVAGASAFARTGFTQIGFAQTGVSQDVKPDITLRISPVSIEIAPGHIIMTTGYNGSAPGPGIPMSGLMKDVVMVPPRKQVEVDFVADNPGPTLFHCHQQMHMDYGFMTMVEYLGYQAPPLAPHGHK